MLDSTSEIFSVLETYKYLIIFPVTIIEGPIIMIVSGFLVYLGVMDFAIAFPLLVLADMLGDSMYHTIGRYWRSSERARRFAKFFGFTEKSEEFLETHFRTHKFKTLFFAKFTHGVGAVIQIASGIARMDFLQFLAFSFINTIPKTLILMVLGFYAGSYIAKIDSLLSSIAIVTVCLLAVLVLVYVLLNRKLKNFFVRK